MYTINHDVFIYADLPVIFEAISQPDKINQWWTNRCRGIPKIGETYNFYFTDEYDWLGKVHSIEYGKSIYWIMTESDEDWDKTIFGFNLVAVTKGKTRVQFSHIGWKATNEHYKQTSFCWAMYLYLLKKLIENQEVTLFKDRIYT